MTEVLKHEPSLEELIKEYTFYKTTGIVSHIENGKVLKEFPLEFRLACQVTPDRKIRLDKIILSFGEECHYEFDEVFVSKHTKEMEKNKSMTLCINSEKHLYVNRDVMEPLIANCVVALTVRSIRIAKDYSAFN